MLRFNLAQNMVGVFGQKKNADLFLGENSISAQKCIRAKYLAPVSGNRKLGIDLFFLFAENRHRPKKTETAAAPTKISPSKSASAGQV